MTTAGAVAIELRKLADSLDQNPAAEVPSPNIYFSCYYLGPKAKDVFLGLVKIMPRPLKKEYRSEEVWVKYDPNVISVSAYIERSKVCELVESAKSAVYRCEPLLSEEETESATA
jgi:hypothetical protein